MYRGHLKQIISAQSIEEVLDICVKVMVSCYDWLFTELNQPLNV